jgi:hypothetical protein
MEEAVLVAKGKAIYKPLTQEEKLQLFRAVSQHMGGSGHWYECPNGHHVSHVFQLYFPARVAPNYF